MSAHRIEHHDDGEVVHIALVVDGEWARAEFPHPLITVDYDAKDNVIGISGVGSFAPLVARTYSEWLDAAATPSELVEMLRDEVSA